MENAAAPPIVGSEQQQVMTVQAVQVLDQENVDPQTQPALEAPVTQKQKPQKAVVKPPVGKVIQFLYEGHIVVFFCPFIHRGLHISRAGY